MFAYWEDTFFWVRLFEGKNGKKRFHFHKFKMKKKMYAVLLLPFFVLLVSISYYLYKVNNRDTQSRRFLMSVFLTLNISHTIFWVTIADFKQEYVYLESFFWLWNFIHIHRFFSKIKRCCQVHVQATSLFKISIGMFQKEVIFSYF